MNSNKKVKRRMRETETGNCMQRAKIKMKAVKSGKRKKKMKDIVKERDCEDWCFVCKDGGDLILCDFHNCLKVYHPGCVGKEDTLMETGEHWTCDRHSCLFCSGTPKFHCYCCPDALCGHCIATAEFAPVRGKKGFCSSCLELVLLVEEKENMNIDEDKIDLQDRNTYECLFLEYWDIIKEEEGLTLDDVYCADSRLKKGQHSDYGSQSYKIGKSKGSYGQITSSSDLSDSEESETMGKRTGPKKLEFVGWGSKPLIEFLRSLGKDTTEELSQYDIESIICTYIQQKNLYDPWKRKKILCDDSLYSIFRRKSILKNRIYSLLEAHLVVNINHSEDDESGHEVKGTSHDQNEETVLTCKKRRLVSSAKNSEGTERNANIQESSFASILSENLKLIYLRRSLVEELWYEPQKFAVKVVGSFVKVKTGCRDYTRRSSHQLLQVTGIKSTGEDKSEIVLRVSNLPTDVHISSLSDYDIREEEIDDLRENVDKGLLPKLTVVELEEKARSLHEDITKHWIKRELVRIQSCIDFANEKGWRRELYEYLEQIELLKNPTEQERLLQNRPKVVAEVVKCNTDEVDILKTDAGGPLKSEY
ncbi:hypothetical protein K2173_012078 [Erythroxylum novogranatense]|uniref:Uncharacterized protein n=1 Tax=Erythroxylum novogranatense TaxID=1862640 RepID=A0AAV8TEZ3_9ROSI|nr:hypothetical protein K2173_012078 [Erythroxylum novogranatense]